MRRNVWFGLALLLCVRPSVRLAAEDLAVLHAEVPAFTEVSVKARLAGTVLVRVRIDPAGDVLSSTVEKALPMGLDRSAKAAALRWKFSPSARGEVREALLSFLFDHGTTSEPSHEEGALAGPLTLHVVYEHSTVLWLPRENGEIPEKLCPVHGTILSVEPVELRGGLPSSRGVDETPEGKRREAERDAYAKALRQAEKDLFPESNRFYPTGCSRPPEEKAEVYYCQACRDAEEAWRENHPEPAPDDPPEG